MTAPHEKSMWRYSSEARSIAAELAEFAMDEAEEHGIGAEALRAMFEGIDQTALFNFEDARYDEIAEFVRRPPSQWNAALRRISVQADDERSRVQCKLVLLTLAVIAAKRVEEIVLLRDEYRRALAPGSGYRVTASELYQFAHRLDFINAEISWPVEAFDAAQRERESL